MTGTSAAACLAGTIDAVAAPCAGIYALAMIGGGVGAGTAGGVWNVGAGRRAGPSCPY